jgi:hypothetical protein
MGISSLKSKFALGIALMAASCWSLASSTSTDLQQAVYLFEWGFLFYWGYFVLFCFVYSARDQTGHCAW